MRIINIIALRNVTTFVAGWSTKIGVIDGNTGWWVLASCALNAYVSIASLWVTCLVLQRHPAEVLPLVEAVSSHFGKVEGTARNQQEVHVDVRSGWIYIGTTLLFSRSIGWLKLQFRRLGLYRRDTTSLAPVPVVRNCIRVSDYFVCQSPCITSN